MKRTRMSGNERRAQIITAARKVFSQSGYDGAKTLQIAREAGVSEALVYRHFPSKLALYRAVLRQIFQEQDERWQEQGFHGTGAAGLIAAIQKFISTAVSDAADPGRRDINRMTLASLASDGSYASLIYRRSQRRNAKAMAQAYDSAREEGAFTGEAMDTPAAAMFIEHVGTMLTAIAGQPYERQLYGIEGDNLVRQATLFCLRGIGMKDEVIERHFA